MILKTIVALLLNNMRYPLVIIVSALILASCKPTQQATTSQGGKYYEDLSAHRPVVQIQEDTTNTQETIKRDPKATTEAKFTVNQQLNAVLDSIDRINLEKKYIDGYTIQVYSGANREDALNAKKELTLKLPELESEIQFRQPTFRVRVGKYYTQLEAQKSYMAVKQIFQTAIIVPDRFTIN